MSQLGSAVVQPHEKVRKTSDFTLPPSVTEDISNAVRVDSWPCDSANASRASLGPGGNGADERVQPSSAKTSTASEDATGVAGVAPIVPMRRQSQITPSLAVLNPSIQTCESEEEG